MKKTLILIILAATIPALALVIMVLVSDRNATVAANINALSAAKLGAGSIRFDRASAVSASTNLGTTMDAQPIPTNKWWGSAITGDWPETLHALPWAAQVGRTGLSIGAPTPVASSNQVTLPFQADITMKPGATSQKAKVRSYDDAAVTLDIRTTTGELAYSLRLVKGVPFVYVTLNQDAAFSAKAGAWATRQLPDGRSAADVTIEGRAYTLYAPVQAKFATTNAGLGISAAQEGTEMVLAALPLAATSEARAQYDASSAAAVMGAEVSFEVEGSQVRTQLEWKTTGTGEPLYLVLPGHLGATSGKSMFGSLATIRGAAKIVKGSQLSYTLAVPAAEATPALPQDDAFFKKATLETYLQQAVTELKPPSALSYNGGKELFRLANLLMVAKQSGSSTAKDFQDLLRSQLVNWYTYVPGEQDRYFYYDAKVRGLVAQAPEFGSEAFNDHHFHYGYFLYASSLLARYDNSFVKDYGKVVDLLAQDIAHTDRSQDDFPYLRTYDVYEGHSWADGLNRFADGNNQESVSEAANAWYGLMLWGEVSQNDQLTRTGKWLYANETNAALTYYFNNTTNPFPAGYAHHQYSLVWGGKNVWETFFSAAPEAKHGILMLPLSGGSLYLNTGGNVAADLAALNQELGGKPLTQWQDTIIMAQALADPKSAQAAFKPGATLDNSNSQAFMYYWLGWMGQRGNKL